MIQNVTERYFFFSLSFKWCSQNEFASQFTYLQPHLYVKIHQALENDNEQHFNC